MGQAGSRRTRNARPYGRFRSMWRMQTFLLLQELLAEGNTLSCLRRVPFPCVARKGAPPVAESSDRGGWAGTWFCTNEVQGKTLVPTRRKEPKDAFFTSELHSVGAGNGAAEIQAVAPLPGLYQLRCVSPPRSHARIPRQLRPRRCIIRPCGGGREPDRRHVCRPYRRYLSKLCRGRIYASRKSVP